MAQRNDQVFQLSLTEIAFTIAFILLLLLGYLVSKEQTQRVAAEAELAKVQSTERAEAALSDAKSTLSAALAGAGTPNPDEIISKLIAAGETRTERDRLRREVEDLDAKLTALTELKNQLERIANSGGDDVTKEEVVSALALQEQVRRAIEQEVEEDAPGPRHPKATASAAASSSAGAPLKQASTFKPSTSQRNRDLFDRVKQALATRSELRKQLRTQLDRELKPGLEHQTIQEVVAAAKGYGELERNGRSPDTMAKENADLRGQVRFMKNKLDARGGRDYPPCWADEDGKVQFLFSVETKPDFVVVAPAWPPQREADARALPGIAEVLGGSPHSSQSFVSRIQGIFNASKSADPQCRHYVQLKSSIADAVQSDRARLMVENYFYKSEVRR